MSDKQFEKLEEYVSAWLGSVLGKLDRIKKMQKYHMLTVILLQIIMLILLLSKL